MVWRWSRWPLFWRLYGALLLGLGVLSGVYLWLQFRTLYETEQHRLRADMETAAQLVSPVVVEAVLTGDQARLADALQAQVDAMPGLAAMTWEYNGIVLRATARLPAPVGPAWWRRALARQPEHYDLDVQVGGVSYGRLRAEADLTAVSAALWKSVQQLALLQGAGALIVAVMLALLLAGPHRALHRLTLAIQRLRHDRSVRVVPPRDAGPELAALADAFNAMASEIEASMQALAQAHRHKLAEAQRLHTILMSIGDAVVVTDAAGQVVMLNASASRLLAVPEEQLLGRPVAQAIRLVDERTGAAVDLPRMCEVSGAMPPRLSAPVCLLAADGGKKPVDVSMATVRLSDGSPMGCVHVLADASARRAWEQQLTWQATHDALTGLPNRALLGDRLRHALARARRGGALVGVALLDLDEFKPVNDRLGHAAGDLLLKQVAARGREVLRETDTLARLGGDEFALVLAEPSSADAIEATLQRLAVALSQPFDIQGHAVRVSASVGYTIYPLDDSDADTLLRHADEAMYEAKRAGRNQVCRYRSLDSQGADARPLQRALRQAMQQGQMVWYYQPVVDLRRGEIIGWEALVRWQHPERGLLPPAEFMPWLNSPTLQIELDRMALADAVRQLANWHRLGHDWLVAVNVSVAHFLSPDFGESLRQLLEDAPPGLASSLIVEVVENADLHDAEQARRAAAHCHALGVRLALDDFGVGYASLSRFKMASWDVVKIDRSFVAEMAQDWTDLATVETVVDMARIFGRRPWAEGMERAEMGTLLLSCGCDWAQGFAIARPMPAGEVLPWAQAWRPDPSWGEWPDAEWDARDFPLLVARLDHMRWVERVLATLQGQALAIDTAELHDHHRCRLGQWVDTRGSQRYGNLPAFVELQPVHEEVHRCGVQLVSAVAAGEHERAHRLGERLRALQAQVLTLLGRLQREVAQRTAGVPGSER